MNLPTIFQYGFQQIVRRPYVDRYLVNWNEETWEPVVDIQENVLQ